MSDDISRMLNYVNEETGFPLEIEISSKMDNDFEVFNNFPYRDEDTSKERTIDIVAPFRECLVQNTSLSPFFFLSSLAIECKKSPKKWWLIYTRPKKTYLSFTGQYTDHIQAMYGQPSPLFDEIFQSDRTLFVHYNNFLRIGISHTMYDPMAEEDSKKKKGSSGRRDKVEGRDDLFQALMQVIKFINYRFWFTRENTRELFKLWLFFPTIVLDGRLFEIIIENGKGSEAQERQHILYQQAYYSKHFNHIRSFLIDIVKRDYFDRFLEYVKSDFHLLQENIKNKLRILEEISREEVTKVSI